MLKWVGAFLLSCAAGAWGLALIGQVPAHTGASLSLMFSGLAIALVPWWFRAAPDPAAEIVAEPAPQLIDSVVVTEPEPARGQSTAPVGSVPAIMPEILAPARGVKTEIRRAYDAYVEACRRSGAQAVPPVEFVPMLKTLCDVLNIQTRRRGEYIYLIDVGLSS